uniref:PH domain-containing protein n=1 Tax=Caenorhabditis tropicalis TaxID=1561998 RepID=A0A1I7UTP6_9PELO
MRNNWFNLENFMSCRHIDLQLGENSNRTAETYNSFFTKWMDSEDALLQQVSLSCFVEPEKLLITRALGRQGAVRRIRRKWIELKRNDGSEFFIYKSHNDIHIHTKESYLEKLREEERREILRRDAIMANLRALDP